MQIEGNVVLSAEDAAETIRQLTSRVKRLEREIENERSNTPQRVADAMHSILSYLRMHGVVLLNLRTESARELQRRLELDVITSAPSGALAALYEAWNLQNAPLPQTVIEQVRQAADRGNCRWY